MALQAKVKQKIARMKEELAQAAPQELAAHEERVDRELARLEAQRDLTRHAPSPRDVVPWVLDGRR